MAEKDQASAYMLCEIIISGSLYLKTEMQLPTDLHLLAVAALGKSVKSFCCVTLPNYSSPFLPCSACFFSSKLQGLSHCKHCKRCQQAVLHSCDSGNKKGVTLRNLQHYTKFIPPDRSTDNKLVSEG